jgi:hypothetical protein
VEADAPAVRTVRRRFSPLRHCRGLRVFSDGEPMMLAYGLEHVKRFCVFLFGQKIDLEIEMVSLIRLGC